MLSEVVEKAAAIGNVLGYNDALNTLDMLG